MIVKTDVLLSDYTTLGCGGLARYFVEVENRDELEQALSFARVHHLSFLTLGKGSNSLFSDQGYSGLIILNKMHYIKSNGPEFTVSSGYSFSHLGTLTSKQGYSGLEFAAGIPGSVGGAVYMNAGASGFETKDSLVSALFMNVEGQSIRFEKDEMEFKYRSSVFHRLKGVILEATFLLSPSTLARKKQLEILSYRTKTQPYSSKSAGCFFKNPKGVGAGALIDQLGLKGLSIGDAQVSSLHGNFIVNKNQAKSEDILKLAELVKNRVYEKSGIMLELEVNPIPYQGS